MVIKGYLLFAAVYGTALSLLGIGGVWAGFAVGAVIFGSVWAARKRKTVQTVVLCAVAVAILGYFLIYRAEITNGLKILANALFERSESMQAYIYRMFGVNDASAEIDVKHGLYFAAGALSVVFVLLHKQFHVRVLCVAVFLLLALTVAYFGVSPSYAWCAAFLAAIGVNLLSIDDVAHIDQGVVLLAVIVVITGGILLTGFSENPYISELDEGLRDRLALNVQPVSAGEFQVTPEPEDTPAETPKPESSQPDLVRRLKDFEITLSDTVKLILLILIILIVLFVPAVFIDRLNARIRRGREGLSDPDNNKAILAMFRYTMRRLLAYGLNPLNGSYYAYEPQIAELISENVSEKYKNAVALWQESVYSRHEMTREQRAEMREFMRCVVDSIEKSEGWRRRLKTMLRCGL